MSRHQFCKVRSYVAPTTGSDPSSEGRYLFYASPSFEKDGYNVMRHFSFTRRLQWLRQPSARTLLVPADSVSWSLDTFVESCVNVILYRYFTIFREKRSSAGSDGRTRGRAMSARTRLETHFITACERRHMLMTRTRRLATALQPVCDWVSSDTN